MSHGPKVAEVWPYSRQLGPILEQGPPFELSPQESQGPKKKPSDPPWIEGQRGDSLAGKN